VVSGIFWRSRRKVLDSLCLPLGPGAWLDEHIYLADNESVSPLFFSFLVNECSPEDLIWREKNS
jgi:hypothetical protein